MRTIIFCCMFLMSVALQAQKTDNSPQFIAKVSEQEIQAGIPFEVDFQYTQGQNGQFVEPNWEKSGFSVVGTSQSSSISISNRVTTSSVRYQYTLVARDTGTLMIPAATIKEGKAEYHTEPVTIHVLANPNGVQEFARPNARQKDKDVHDPQEKLKKQIKTTRI